MSKPSTKGLKRLIIPHGVYTRISARITRDLMTIYRKVRRGSLTKRQAKEEGEKILLASQEKMMMITRRYFKKNGLTIVEPETTDEIERFTKEKIEEWGRIVSDM